MKNISPGYLHSSFKLLEMLAVRKYGLTSLTTSLTRIEVLPAVDVVNFALGIGWILSDEDGNAITSISGTHIRSLPSTSDRFRQAILDFIGAGRPAWSQLTPRGRNETLSALSPEVWQCFAEAELIGSYSNDVVRWWDALAARARGQRSETLLETGRVGERLSIEYEQKRTGQTPKWQAVESNLAGYDILSIMSLSDRRKLQIEVKATQGEVKSSVFHVTRSEWDTGTTADQYLFHLWSVGQKPPTLAILERAELAPHVPTDGGAGLWESVEIPFAAFLAAFERSPNLTGG